MKYIVIAICVVLVYVVFSSVRVFIVYQLANNPNIRQDFKILGSGPRIRYIAAGDSTAVGEGASAVEKTYTYKLADSMAHGNQVEYKNVALIGATTDSFITDQLQQIIDYKPDVVTISIGANDRTHLKSNAGILDNYKKIISELTEKTQARIYITDIPNFRNAALLPMPFRSILESRSRTLNPEILALETSRVKVVDIHDFGWDNYPDIAKTFAKDQFHPNDLGYENWTNAFLYKIQGH